ncbi:MAG: SCO family protein, partial [Burkholderiaceae bacterium]
MVASNSRRETVARRLSAAVCLLLLVASAYALNRITSGFEVWTFEGRRTVQLQAGRVQAQTVALRGLDGQATALWSDTNAAPAAYLVDFIYTRCPSICLALGSEYQQMQLSLAHAHDAPPKADAASGGVHLVSLSFDVAHDDAAQLAQYAARLNADPRWWTFAVPASERDARALLRSLGVVAVPDGQGGFVHNGAIHLLDAHGTLRGLFAFDAWPQALAAAMALASTS